MRAATFESLGEAADRVVRRILCGSPLADPRPKCGNRTPNNPRHEWLFSCLTGKNPAEQKSLILAARHPSVGFLEDADAEILISALGLGEA